MRRQRRAIAPFFEEEEARVIFRIVMNRVRQAALFSARAADMIEGERNRLIKRAGANDD